jgi:hypothetical protein
MGSRLTSSSATGFWPEGSSALIVGTTRKARKSEFSVRPGSRSGGCIAVLPPRGRRPRLQGRFFRPTQQSHVRGLTLFASPAPLARVGGFFLI